MLGATHLVREVIRADEAGTGREGDCKRRLGVVEQDFDTHGQRAGGSDEFARDRGHDGDRLAPGLDAVRLVALVLDEDAVECADAVRRELGQCVRDDGRETGRAGIAGQRRQVDHADQGLRRGEAISEAGHAAWYAAASHVRLHAL